MRILISGGTGLIGRALTKALVAKGDQVTILSRSPQKYQAEMADVRLVAWNGSSPEGWGHLIEETDAVINLAGASIAGESMIDILTKRWSRESKGAMLASRFMAGIAITQAIEAAQNKPRVLLQASAVGYYGPHGLEDVAEDSPAGDDFLASICAAWEQSTAAVEALGVRRIIMRTGLVLAGDGGILPMILLPFRLFAGGRMGSGRQGVPWIHIADEIGAILFLLENEAAQGAYNLSAPNPVTNAEFGKVAARVLKRPFFLPTPAFALKLALGEKSTLVLDGQRAVPARLLTAGYPFAFTDLEHALRALVRR
jgi:hypothetical protein